jgi:hypothetical protein
MKTKQKIKILTDPAEILGGHAVVIQETRGETPLKPAGGGSATCDRPALQLRETFNADSVTIELPGNSTTHTRAEVEGWLVGMNAARRLSDDDACREAVAVTIKANADGAAVKESGQKGTSALPRLARTAAAIAMVAAAAGLLTQPRSACASEIVRGYKALRQSGYSEQEAKQMTKEADAYFGSIGVRLATRTRIPANRKRSLQ